MVSGLYTIKITEYFREVGVYCEYENVKSVVGCVHIRRHITSKLFIENLSMEKSAIIRAESLSLLAGFEPGKQYEANEYKIIKPMNLRIFNVCKFTNALVLTNSK